LECYSRPTVYASLTCQISSRLVYSVTLCWRKTTIFEGFCTSAFSGVANWQQSEKVEHRCTTTNLPLSNGIKIVSVFQCLHGEIKRTISDVQKHDEQTDRQTDKQAGLLLRLDCAPSSECPSSECPQASIAARCCAAGSIRISHRAPCCCSTAIARIAPSVLFESSHIFLTIHRRHRRKK